MDLVSYLDAVILIIGQFGGLCYAIERAYWLWRDIYDKPENR